LSIGENPVPSLRLLEPVVFGSESGIGFRLYPDNRPRNLEIATLQKGLVMTFRGEELIEEGAGFGVPIAKYDENTFFSSTAQVFLDKKSKDSVTLRKVFFLDSVSKKQVRGAFVNDTFYDLLHETFERAYLRKRRIDAVFDWTMRLRKVLGVKTQFIRVKSKGAVAVTYRCVPGAVEITVDLSALNKAGAQEILILNEQGASTFRKYNDADGVALHDQQIGAWSRVTATEAAFSDLNQNIVFTLKKKPNALLIRGREQIRDRFSWAGMTYALSPRISHLEYTIRL